jgi:hypothetical protein
VEGGDGESARARSWVGRKSWLLGWVEAQNWDEDVRKVGRARRDADVRPLSLRVGPSDPPHTLEPTSRFFWKPSESQTTNFTIHIRFRSNNGMPRLRINVWWYWELSFTVWEVFWDDPAIIFFCVKIFGNLR